MTTASKRKGDRAELDPARELADPDRIAHTMRIANERWTRTGQPRTDQEGRAGRTPKTDTPWIRPTVAPITNTVTWTVDADMPGLKGQHPDQLSLLDQEAS